MFLFVRHRLILVITLFVFFGSGYYVWEKRYFLRFIPVPLAMANLINSHSLFFPAFEDGILNGKVDFPYYDLTTKAGLRKTLNSIRAYSPLKNSTGRPDYTNLTFEKWLREIQTKSFMCTDATQLFIAVAWAQGLKAREWHLLPPGWPPGRGHSIVELLNPNTDRWHLVDAQHAAIISDKNSGHLIDMLEVLKRYKSGQSASIHIDYGPYKQFFVSNNNQGIGPTQQYLFKEGYLSTPVLQLRQATWYARYPKQFGLSGNFVIGYPIIMDSWSHRNEIILSKLFLLIFLFTGLSILISILRSRTQKTKIRRFNP